MSNQTSQYNLDRLAALHAQELIKCTSSEIDNTVTKALGVLQENGVYACFLYLLAKEGENGRSTVKEMLCLLNDILSNDSKYEKSEVSDPKSILQYITSNITNDLEQLLLAKEVLEQMLIYARYGAKASNK